MYIAENCIKDQRYFKLFIIFMNDFSRGMISDVLLTRESVNKLLLRFIFLPEEENKLLKML